MSIPGTPRTLADLVRVGDHRRRPHRHDQPRQLGRGQQRALQVHVRVDQPGHEHQPLGRERPARPPLVAAHPGDPAVGDHDVGRLDPAVEDVDDLAARRSAGRPAPAPARRGSAGRRIVAADLPSSRSDRGARPLDRQYVSHRPASSTREQLRAFLAEQAALDLERAAAHLGQDAASTCSSQKPASAASAIVAPKTTRSIFAQWIAARHIGQGSQVEYIVAAAQVDGLQRLRRACGCS